MTDLAEKLTRWRHLIEPETSGGLTPVSWDAVLTMPLELVEGDKSVLVLRDCEIGGCRVRTIWVAAGELGEVLQLMKKAEDDARVNGIFAMVYMGRRGWVRAAKYSELATVGRKEL